MEGAHTTGAVSYEPGSLCGPQVTFTMDLALLIGPFHRLSTSGSCEELDAGDGTEKDANQMFPMLSSACFALGIHRCPGQALQH